MFLSKHFPSEILCSSNWNELIPNSLWSLTQNHKQNSFWDHLKPSAILPKACLFHCRRCCIFVLCIYRLLFVECVYSVNPCRYSWKDDLARQIASVLFKICFVCLIAFHLSSQTVICGPVTLERWIFLSWSVIPFQLENNSETKVTDMSKTQ